jgi:RHS repeat-associated protein
MVQTLDAVGNRTERVDGLGTHTYDYDELYRLTEVTYPGPSTTSYTYDAIGNRETMEDGSSTTTYAYDDADQLTSVAPPGQQAIEYSWDDNGNLLERGTDTYDWDAADRMTSATVGSVTTDMVYRGGGLRDSRTVDEDTVTFTWDVARSIPQLMDDGTLAYVYGLDRIAQVADDDTTYYYLSDGLGSVMALTDADGDVVNTYDYDVFGAVRSSTGSQPNEFRFTGEQWDDSASLQYLRARYYDPSIGRFLARDPIPFLQRYAYVWNNPIRYIDPLGLKCSKSPLDWGECVSDKAADIKDWGTDVYNHPGSAIQITAGTAVALTSTGDRRRVDGATIYENCQGTCQLVNPKYAVTIGHTIFAEAPVGEQLLTHELTHVAQGDKYGLWWAAEYFAEYVRHGYDCNRFEEEARWAAGEPSQCEDTESGAFTPWPYTPRGKGKE